MSSSTSEPKNGSGIAVAALLIAAGAAWLVTSGGGAENAPPASEPTPSAAPASNERAEQPTAAQATAPAAPPVAQQVPAAKPARTFTLTNGAQPGKIRMPDGSIVDAINDVTQDIDMVWDEQPFSPIVDTVYHNGWWWWKHQDDSWSTVKMIDMNGVPQPTPIHSRPGKGPPAPTADEAMEKMRQQQQGAGR